MVEPFWLSFFVKFFEIDSACLCLLWYNKKKRSFYVYQYYWQRK